MHVCIYKDTIYILYSVFSLNARRSSQKYLAINLATRSPATRYVYNAVRMSINICARHMV